MTSNSKSEGRDFVYVGADDIYLCPAGERLSYRYTNEEDGKTLRRYWTRRIDGSDPRVRRAPRTWSHRPTISVRVFTPAQPQGPLYPNERTSSARPVRSDVPIPELGRVAFPTGFVHEVISWDGITTPRGD